MGKYVFPPNSKGIKNSLSYTLTCLKIHAAPVADCRIAPPSANMAAGSAIGLLVK